MKSHKLNASTRKSKSSMNRDQASFRGVIMRTLRRVISRVSTLIPLGLIETANVSDESQGRKRRNIGISDRSSSRKRRGVPSPMSIQRSTRKG